MMQEYADWDFPLVRTHCGMLLGNARLGVMIWGGGDTLRFTLGRVDLWDHRGGMAWSPEHNFKNIRKLLEGNDGEGLRALFGNPAEKQSGQPSRPSIIGVGRVELHLPQGAVLRRGRLFFASGRIEIVAELDGADHILVCELGMAEDLLSVQIPPALCGQALVSGHPAMEFLGDALRTISFAEPQAIAGDGAAGWWQPLPADPGVCVLHAFAGQTLLVTAARAASAADAQVVARDLVSRTERDLTSMRVRNAAWWGDYWRDVPRLELPNSRLQFLYQYGMYKFAGLSQPGGIAATLQGPWVEEYQLPPWSNDYHFNINVQMCYWPAYRGNRLAHLRPLFDLVLSWEPVLIDIARKFAGVEDGRMLPHSVDDRCVPMGGFWTGMIDHACTAWVAQMMYDYTQFAPDPVFLREKALPFMRGTFRVFAAMLEERDGRYHLPVSVSPEYGGCEMNAWGRNASFQLAAIHRLCQNLQSACRQLGLAEDPLWEKVDRTLPPASIQVRDGKARIALWDDQELEVSHRHHSHLGGLYPFDTLDLAEPATRELVGDSIVHWIYKGMSLWTGWCVPWAAILYGRLGNGAMAELLLEIWQKVFTNEGYGTLHDCNFAGFSLMGARPPFSPDQVCANVPGRRCEIMQMDAGMGVTAAILEMLVMDLRGVHYIFRGIPDGWGDCAFSGVRTAGGFLLTAQRRAGRFVRLEVSATADGSLTLANPLCSTGIPGTAPSDGQAVTVTQNGKSWSCREAQLVLHLKAGEMALVEA